MARNAASLKPILLVLFCRFCSGFKIWNSGRLEQTSLKVLQCGCGLRLYIVFFFPFLFFLKVIPIIHEIHGYSKAFPLPKATPTPKRRMLSPWPESSLGMWQCSSAVVLLPFLKLLNCQLLWAPLFCPAT